MSDLRESGAIEQDADCIIFLHRDRDPDVDRSAPGACDLIVEKYHRLIYPRPGVNMDAVSLLPNATIVDAPLMEISSSFIRKAIREGKDIRHLVPAPTYKYMREMHFYEK